MNHEEMIRTVVGVAHEIRIELQDANVIFGSVARPRLNVGDFVIRPWGWKLPMTIRFDDVLRAAPVKGMVWQRQRAIAMAQMAGIFKRGSLVV